MSSSVSASPSAGYQDYTKGDYEDLPADNTNLEHDYTEQEYTDVADDDEVYVDQTGAGQHIIHQFKDFVGDWTRFHVEGEFNVTQAPSVSTVYLQIYNFDTPEWETLDSNNTGDADTDYVLEGNITENAENYKDAQLIVSCRIYQEAII